MKRLVYPNLIQNLGLAVDCIDVIGSFLQSQLNGDSCNAVLVGLCIICFAGNLKGDLLAIERLSFGIDQFCSEYCLFGLFV